MAENSAINLESSLTSAGLDERRRRILFRSWHRGMREVDMLLGRFADARLADLAESDLNDYERMLTEAADRDILGWLTGEIAVPAEFDRPVLAAIRDFHTHDGPIHS